MRIETYEKIVQELTDDRKQVSSSKREDYTVGSANVLQNFYNQAEALGIDPKVSLGVHMEKQFSAVMNYIKTNGQSESEPIIKRIGDCINYLELLWGLINDAPVEYEVFVDIPHTFENTSVGISSTNDRNDMTFEVGDIVYERNSGTQYSVQNIVSVNGTTHYICMDDFGTQVGFDAQDIEQAS
jgi:hypothetical protein